MAEEKFTIEVYDDSEDVMRNYIGDIKDKNGKVVASVEMYWDELSGEDEDFDEEDEDSGELPYFGYEVNKIIYNANKEFFDQFAKDKGFEIEVDEEEDDDYCGGVQIEGELDVSPTMRTVKRLTKEFLQALKDGGVSPFAGDINEWIDPSKIKAVSGGKIGAEGDPNDFALRIGDVNDMGDGKYFFTPIKTIKGQPLVNVNLFWSSGDEVVPCLLFEFKEIGGGVKFYKANKNFFDKYFKSLGLKLIEDKEESHVVYFLYEVKEVSKNACKKYATDLGSAMSNAGVTKSPVEESYRRNGLKESLNKSRTKYNSTKKYMDDDISLVDLVSKD